MPLNILADENIPRVVDAFSTLGEVKTLSGREISKTDLTKTDILLVRSVTQVNESLLSGTPVKFVASATAGFDHIDLEYLQSQGIAFARAPGSNAISAAEYVIAAICFWSLQKDKPLSQSTIGIIGCGNVGSRVKKLCERLNIEALVNDPPLAEQGVDNLVSLDRTLGCDIITLHTPLIVDGNHPTLELLNQQRINNLKPGTLLINASRGEVVNQSALLKRMQSKQDLSLVLDVWLNEPDIDLNMLRETLIGTAHIAGYSADGKIRGTEMIYSACCDFLNSRPKWSSRDVDFEGFQPYEMNHSGTADSREEILKAYDITTDDKLLKLLLQNDTLVTPIYFDTLRKNYAIRREWGWLD